MVEGEGFEPSKTESADLQSAPFDRSGTPPRKERVYYNKLFLLVKDFFYFFAKNKKLSIFCTFYYFKCQEVLIFYS